MGLNISTQNIIIAPKIDNRKLTIEEKARRKFNELKKENPKWVNCNGHYVGVVVKETNSFIVFDGLMNKIGEYNKTTSGVREARVDAINSSYTKMGNSLNSFGGHVFHFVISSKY